MDLDSAAAIAAVAPPAVFSLGGRTFVLTALADRDELAIYQEMRRQVMAEADDPIIALNARVAEAERLRQPLSPTVIKYMTEAAMSAAARKERKAEPTMAEVGAYAHTYDGGTWLIWFRLRKADPAVTLEWVREQVPDGEAVQGVLMEMARLAGLKDLDPKKA